MTEKLMPTGHERILVVDDEEAIIRMYRATLDRLGYTVLASSDREKTF